ncbi:MAG: bifunctional hydroxymethylpyrimidine kinase/phosphomethylpyrimidine kinase, partial [Planctomycetes bacterium]|nr:bifunctional hydroxymethylpyrimidine kinase/phosphomethylpyrimidine kinase [Planctomycetota bacterium]
TLSLRDAGRKAEERRREPGPGIRGSGCRLASALAAGLARGRNPVQAAKEAGDWVAQRIRQARA